jgi:hypothetical protein
MDEVPFNRAARRVLEPAANRNGLTYGEPDEPMDVVYVSGRFATVALEGDYKEHTITPVIYPTPDWKEVTWLVIDQLGAVYPWNFRGSEQPPRVSKTVMSNEEGVEGVLREWLPWLERVVFPRL